MIVRNANRICISIREIEISDINYRKINKLIKTCVVLFCSSEPRVLCSFQLDLCEVKRFVS